MLMVGGSQREQPGFWRLGGTIALLPLLSLAAPGLQEQLLLLGRASTSL